MKNEKMENWKVALISILSTIALFIIVLFTIAVIQSGTAEVVKKAIEEDYCRNISITEARDLEICE